MQSIPNNVIDSVILSCSKPARYAGGELNQVIKDPSQVSVRYAFMFPDIYEIGMSNLGMRILYHVLNLREDCYCERFFAPWCDMEEHMRNKDIRLFSVETRTPLCEFDLIGVTLGYELGYTNFLNMLSLGGVPLFARDRGESDPIVMAGGTCTYNPEPFADFCDLILIGEGEEEICDVVDLFREKQENSLTKEQFLIKAAQIPGVYVPSLYNAEYDEVTGRFKALIPTNGAPASVVKRIIDDFDSSEYPTKMIVPYMNIVHDRIMLEIMRGCTRGCRFCQAGMIYRPVREKSPQTLKKLANAIFENTGYDEMSLTSLSSGDYSCINELVKDLVSEFNPKGVSVALPSQRLDAFKDSSFKDELAKYRKTGLTFAPEAGTQRLRDVINKGISYDDLIKTCEECFKAGWDTVKLYFMIGLPTETREDVQGICDMVEHVKSIYRSVANRYRLNLSIGVSTFVPKTHTPFQWCGQVSQEDIIAKQDFLMKNIRGRGVTLNWTNPHTSLLEAVFARGDRRLSQVLYNAHKNGCRLDAWNECFDFSKWEKAFEDAGISMKFYANTEYSVNEALPWDHIDCGVSKAFFIREYEKSKNGVLTEDCREGCKGCGVDRICKNGVCTAKISGIVK
ncbi:MAG: TIGR03960 family B12-binding radical SAM protein [Clostridiales bacterium]|nr:TIGR03960 family B12-binding radical SAM protein [Clostridiales bacterium]